LAEAGVSVVRAERLLAARRRAEKQEAAANRRLASELPLILSLPRSTPDRDQVRWPNRDRSEGTLALT
jgi:hypothetical protein